VVVLTRNHVRQTIDTVARLTALPEHPHVIVADNGSTDSTVGLLASLFPQVRIVQGLGDRGMAGFNRAVSLAPTEYVACCDDSTWFAPGALARAVQWLDEHQQVAVVNARVVSHDEREIHPACLMLNATSPGDDDLPGPALANYMAGACVFRAAVFRALGGYEERLSHGGAEELAALDVLAAGHSIVYCESALAHREPLYRWLTRAQHCTHAQRRVGCVDAPAGARRARRHRPRAARVRAPALARASRFRAAARRVLDFTAPSRGPGTRRAADPSGAPRRASGARRHPRDGRKVRPRRPACVVSCRAVRGAARAPGRLSSPIRKDHDHVRFRDATRCRLVRRRP
jgi:hypothetical protein